MSAPVRLGTLGPAGSNHDYVARHYLDAIGAAAEIVLFDDFPAAFAALVAGAIDHVLQVAVHPTVPESVGGNLGRAHLIDSFLAPSQPMAVLTRAEVAQPRSIGLVPPTRSYVDVSRWAEVFEVPSTVDVWEGLQAGRFDSGLTLARFAATAAGAFRVDETVGAVTDAWLVYGRAPLPPPGGAISRDSPGARRVRRAD